MSDPALDALFLPLEQRQLAWPEDGALFLRARAGVPTTGGRWPGLVCEQSFKPLHTALQRAGLDVLDGERADTALPHKPLVLVLPPRQRDESRAVLARALESVRRLQAAGVRVGFAQASDASHNARKLRQLAGNAVAHGLPWDAGLAGLTRVPAETFGVGDRIGTIAVGRSADLVLWSGDPLDVASTADQVWFDGRAIPMRSRQTELRDRYLHPVTPANAGGLPRAYRTR